jgi:hypothetical protein
MLRYKGGDANASTWPKWGYGSDLSIVAGNAPTYNHGSPCLGSNDDSVKFAGSGGSYYDSAATGQIATEDFVIELFALNSQIGYLLSTLKSNTGYAISQSVGNLVNLTVADAGAVTNISFTLLLNRWYHIMIFANRDENSANGVKIYVNSALAASGNISNRAGSLETDNFGIGGYVGGTTVQTTASTIAYCAVWKRANWFAAGAASPTEWAAIAQEHFYRLYGIFPMRALGTAAPNFFTRATDGYLDKYEADGGRYLYNVATGAPRVCFRKDSNGDSIKGYLPELASTNLALRSQEFDNASWLKVRSTVTANSVTAPNKETVGDTLNEDATVDDSHYLTQSISVVNGNYYSFSLWAKKLNRNWIALEVGKTGTNSLVYFDLDNGALGSTPAGTIQQGIELWANGFYRCWLLMQSDVTVATAFNIYAAEGDNDHVFDGLSQGSVYLFGALVVNQNGPPPSYIHTTTGAVTRNKDELQFKADDGNIGGVGSNKKVSVFYDLLLPPQTVIGGAEKTSFSLSDGGSVNDNISGFVGSINEHSGAMIAGGGAIDQANGVIDVADGVKHRCGCTFSVDAIENFVDGAQDGSDSSINDVPDDLDELDIGTNINSALQLDGIISNFEIYPYVTSAPRGS